MWRSRTAIRPINVKVYIKTEFMKRFHLVKVSQLILKILDLKQVLPLKFRVKNL